MRASTVNMSMCSPLGGRGQRHANESSRKIGTWCAVSPQATRNALLNISWAAILCRKSLSAPERLALLHQLLSKTIKAKEETPCQGRQRSTKSHCCSCLVKLCERKTCPETIGVTRR